MNIDREGKPVATQKIEVDCELCGKGMVLRQSRHGSFLGCSDYPNCTSTIACDPQGEPLKLVRDEELEEPCPTCGAGTLKVKRRGARAFLGCDKYPSCKETHPLPEGVRLERKVSPVEEADFPCEKCGRAMVVRTGRRGRFIACSGFPRCRNTKPVEKLEELRAAAAAAGKTASVAPAGGNGSRGNIPTTSDGKVDFEALGAPPTGFAWTRTGKPVVEAWPDGVLDCPQCGSELALKSGRFGPFFSCTNYPKCRCSVNLRGEAKKQAEVAMPAPKKPKPVPTEIPCEACGSPMWVRAGRAGNFLGCSGFPKCKSAKPLPPELADVKLVME